MTATRWTRLDSVLAVALAITYVPLSVWGGAQHWAGRADALPFVLLGGALVLALLQAIRTRSAMITAYWAGCGTMLAIGPSLFIDYSEPEAYSIAVFVSAVLGLGIGLAARYLARATTPSGEPARRFGGWLLLPAVGIGLTPMLKTAAILQSLAFVTAGPRVPEGAVVVTLADILADTVVLFLAARTALRFFEKAPETPGLAIRLLFLMFGVSAMVFVIGAMSLGTREETLLGLARSTGVIGLAAAAAIWIPYFNRSTRVQRTFGESLR